VCGRDDSEIRNTFEGIVKYFRVKIDEIDRQLNEIKEIYANENGFTKDNVEKLYKINNTILEMKISAFIGNRDSFLKLEPNLEILSNYFVKHHPQISLENNLQDLIEIFETEPNENRYKNKIMELNSKKTFLFDAIETIENHPGYFYEVEISFDAYGFTNEGRMHLPEILKKYYENGEEIIKPTKILLCHNCNYLFHKSSQAAYQVIHTNDDDWD
jgi:rubrerythrin